MFREIRKLTAIQTCNLFGINEVRHSKDSRKKVKYALMSLLWLLLGLLLVAYVCGLTYGLFVLGLGHMVPAYLFTVTSLVILFFGIFKAGGVLFGKSSFEAFSALPLRKASVVISRFLTMYISDLLLSAAILIPGLVLYAVLEPQGILYWLVAAAGIILLPLLPLAAASLIGALVTAITSRMKHKGIFSALLSFLFVGAILGSEMMLTTRSEEEIEALMADLASTMGDAINRAYPPARLFGAAIIEGDMLSLAILAAVSIAVPALLVALVTPVFGGLCNSINATSAKGNYKLGSMRSGSQLAALYRVEFKRYLSSGIWLSNSAIGYLMMLAASVALLFVDLEQAFAAIGPADIPVRMIPFFFGMIAFMSTCTSSAISMEGKTWWLTKSLPVSSRALTNSKLLVNLTLALPCWAISAVLINIAVDTDLTGRLWMTCISLLYILLAALMGLRVNAAMPIFNWDNEARVVKQSGAVAVTIFGGWALAIVPAVILFVVPSVLTMLLIGCALAAACIALYASFSRLKPEKLG